MREKRINVRMVIYISHKVRRGRREFIATYAVAGAVVSFATTRVRRGRENREQKLDEKSRRIKTENFIHPLRFARPPVSGGQFAGAVRVFRFHL